jgi:hypothetical protein
MNEHQLYKSDSLQILRRPKTLHFRTLKMDANCQVYWSEWIQDDPTNWNTHTFKAARLAETHAVARLV